MEGEPEVAAAIGSDRCPELVLGKEGVAGFAEIELAACAHTAGEGGGSAGEGEFRSVVEAEAKGVDLNLIKGLVQRAENVVVEKAQDGVRRFADDGGVGECGVDCEGGAVSEADGGHGELRGGMWGRAAGVLRRAGGGGKRTVTEVWRRRK